MSVKTQAGRKPGSKWTGLPLSLVSQPCFGHTVLKLNFGRTVLQPYGRIRVADTGLDFGSVFISFAASSDTSTFEQVDHGDER